MQPFKLHAVIKFRQQLEDNARQNLFTAQEEEYAARVVFEARQQELKALYDTLQQDKEQGTTAARLIMLDNRIALVQEHIKHDQEVLKKAQTNVQNKHKALLKASQDKKIIEKVKEKQDSSYKEYLSKKERTMLDELAVIFHKK
ncbi:MAG: flagellar export protein FliJ [Desulfobulbus propionicus]|nr:MAG: flagellar export protein FliJ [Desulfobulbus propionicus]PIE65837.1 MAG: flagellar export protein FliJ [Desulfobacterales bacterium]